MSRKPNLLFVWTDEQRADTMAAYGNTFVRTPNLNALARESVIFRHAYCTQTVCTPSRSSILTGLYPHTNGCLANNVRLGADIPTIAEMVSDEYLTAYYGKWHLGDEVIAQHGFERWLSIEDNYREFYSDPAYLDVLSDYYHYLVSQGFEPDLESLGKRIYSRRTAARLPEEHTKAAFLGREAARFIREQRGGERPWLLHVNMLEPHMPFTGPYDDLYPPEEVPTGPAFLQPPSTEGARINRFMADYYMSRDRYEGLDLRTEAGWRKLRARYLGLVTQVDNAVGEILRALRESGQDDETIVVFTSDHGDMMGDHGIVAKTVQFEEAMRVPLLVRVPWLREAARTVEGRVSQIDLLPTLLELMGEEIPGHLQGQSRVDVLTGKRDLRGNDVIVEWNGRNGRMDKGALETPDAEGNRFLGAPWRTILHDDWKLCLSADDEPEFYNLSDDPYEQNNLYDVPAHLARITELAARLAGWQQFTGDDVPLPHVC